jgi:hypothetical protein
MARIVTAIGTSHSPALQLPIEEWALRAKWDTQYPYHWYKGKPTTYDEMARLRAGEHLEKQSTLEEMQKRLSRCDRAIEHLSRTVQAKKPDVCIIIGDDQKESFHNDNMPAICIYWGPTLDDGPAETSPEMKAAGLYETPISNPPPERISHPGEPDLGLHIIQSLIKSGFDVSHSKRLPAHADRGLIGHAFNFIYRRIMDNKPIPSVPIFLNTYFPPNQPPIKRCYLMGQKLREAIEAWDSDKTVALFASGGLSHFAVEEDIDQRIIDGMLTNDEEKLTGLPDNYFNSGTSEIRNWLVVAGAMSKGDLKMKLVDYIPCYRSAAGTGFGACFAEWL